MIRIKPRVLTGLMIVALTGTAAGQRFTSAAFAADTPIVMAQNDEDGFWGRLFNKPGSGGSSGPKPLFLDRRDQQAPRASAKKITPYNFSEQTYTSQSASQVDIAEIMEQDMARVARLEQSVMAQTAQIDANVQRSIAAIQQRRAQRLAAGGTARAAGQGSGGTGQPRMVYDPSKVWSYDPNARANAAAGKQQQERPQLFNTR